MWSRRFLIWGLASAAVSAAVSLVLVALALLAFQRTGAAAPLQIVNLALFGVPGIVVYPLCWYMLIFKGRTYTPADTWRLVAFNYGACCLFDCATIYAGQVVALSGDFIGKGPVGWALLVPVLLLAIIGLLILAAIGAGLLAVPFLATAGPVAFVHRALLMRCFAAASTTEA